MLRISFLCLVLVAVLTAVGTFTYRELRDYRDFEGRAFGPRPVQRNYNHDMKEAVKETFENRTKGLVAVAGSGNDAAVDAAIAKGQKEELKLRGRLNRINDPFAGGCEIPPAAVGDNGSTRRIPAGCDGVWIRLYKGGGAKKTV